MKDNLPGGRDLLFEMIGRIETDQTLMGMSAHILTLSKKI
jgi:hypothetical protein